ncbi:MAG: beta-ketoacyl-[acyl-carrier-protein] synthase family protein [Pseudomonadota bacterium]
MGDDPVITGLGVLSALGNDYAEFKTNLFAARSAIRVDPGIDMLGVGAPLSGISFEDHFSRRDLAELDPFSRYAAIAAREAATMAGLTEEGSLIAPPHRRAVIVGSANGGLEVLTEGYRRIFRDGQDRLSPRTIPRNMFSAAASRVAREQAAQGPVFGVSSACSSGAHAISLGKLLLKAGACDIAIVGGTDSCFDLGYLRAWYSIGIVDAAPCRPFSKDRAGISLGEGAAVLILETPAHAEARGARPLARLAGAGMSSSTGALVQSDPAGMVASMRHALEDAGTSASDIGHLNANGTATPANDQAEAEAIRQVFPDRGPVVSSTKGLHGHAMGATGAIEAVATIAALEEQLVPAMPDTIRHDDAIDLDLAIAKPRATNLGWAMSNNFGFGGMNVSLVFCR